MRSDIDTGHALTLVASFALGAAATWLVYAALERRRTPAPISDDALAQHVRARVGELVSRPDAVMVHVEQGVVRLSGQAPQHERDALLASLVDMPGVSRVRNAVSARPSGS